MRQGAQGWCTGMTQGDGMGREVGEGFRMGNTCTPVTDSCQCMAKPIQYCKVNKQEKKKKKGMFRPAHYSLYPLCSQERERRNSFLFFFAFHCNTY